jgi:hypothetical protein
MNWLWVVAAVVVALVTWSLRRRGRPWWRNEYSQRLIDGYTWTHFAFHGVGLYTIIDAKWHGSPLSFSIPLVIILETLWESVENRNWLILWFRKGGDKDYWGDSIGNSAFDLLFCVFGALVTSLFI